MVHNICECYISWYNFLCYIEVQKSWLHICGKKCNSHSFQCNLWLSFWTLLWNTTPWLLNTIRHPTWTVTMTIIDYCRTAFPPLPTSNFLEVLPIFTKQEYVCFDTKKWKSKIMRDKCWCYPTAAGSSHFYIWLAESMRVRVTGTAVLRQRRE